MGGVETLRATHGGYYDASVHMVSHARRSCRVPDCGLEVITSQEFIFFLKCHPYARRYRQGVGVRLKMG